jgi:hypothetical protein
VTETWENTRVTANEAGAFFLRTEVDTGLMFAGIALSSWAIGWRERMERNRSNARAAHDALIRFRCAVHLNAAESAEFEQKFQTLQQRLRELGDSV